MGVATDRQVKRMAEHFMAARRVMDFQRQNGTLILQRSLVHHRQQVARLAGMIAGG